VSRRVGECLKLAKISGAGLAKVWAGLLIRRNGETYGSHLDSGAPSSIARRTSDSTIRRKCPRSPVIDHS
jgi:hypothetical protein